MTDAIAALAIGMNAPTSKVRFVGMQPLEARPIMSGPIAEPDDEAGEQVSVQTARNASFRNSGRQESDHVNFGAGRQTEADNAATRETVLSSK